MSLRGVLSIRRVSTLASAVLITAAFSTIPAVAQRSLVTDWSSHHVKFTNPGSKSDALRNGNSDNWQDIQNNPRFRMQQFRRSAAYANRFANTNVRGLRAGSSLNASTNGDWTSRLGATGFGMPAGKFPAVYDADFATPSCTGDFIVFGVNATGATTQPNIVSFTNLYKGTCSGTIPTVKYAYYVLGGTVTTSPTLSLDGTQLAFVATVNARAYFFLVTPSKAGTTGTVARPTRLRTTSGTGYTVFELDHGEADARSSPYIDFTNNNAYVGDSGGYLHKIENVFGTTAPSEVRTGGWPARPSGGSIILTDPIYDSATNNIFVGGSNGKLYCATASAGASCGNFTVATATGLTGGTAGPIIDSPIVVDTASSGFAGSVFALATYSTASSTTGIGTGHGKSTASVINVLAEAGFTTSGIGTTVGVELGGATVTSTGTSGHTPPVLTVPASTLYDGDFDNEFYNSMPNAFSGNFYVCGSVVANNVTFSTNNPTTYYTTPLLYQVGIAPGGYFDGTVNTSYALALNATTQASGCGSATEFFNQSANSGAGIDYLFLSVTGYGAASSCAGDGCVMSFALPTSGPPPIDPTSAYSLGGNGDGASGIVIDNSSTAPGASQIYFSNLQTGNATQASQAALQ